MGIMSAEKGNAAEDRAYFGDAPSDRMPNRYAIVIIMYGGVLSTFNILLILQCQHFYYIL